ncbi:MAG: hypothetical protein AAF802_10940 [Planctomycetota bacterium]
MSESQLDPIAEIYIEPVASTVNDARLPPNDGNKKRQEPGSGEPADASAKPSIQKAAFATGTLLFVIPKPNEYKLIGDKLLANANAIFVDNLDV